MTEEKLALFDFDDTICRGDSIVPFLFFCIKSGIAPKHQLLTAGAAYVIQRFFPQRAASSKAMTLSFIKQKTVSQMDELANRFFSQVLLPRFFPSAVETINHLKAEGYRVIVISASADVYMRALPRFLPVDAVLSTQCLIDNKDGYTGQIDVNCKGKEKLHRLSLFLDEQDWTIDTANSCAYGDSINDAPMLRFVGHPHRVGNNKKLAQLVPQADTLLWH